MIKIIFTVMQNHLILINVNYCKCEKYQNTIFKVGSIFTPFNLWEIEEKYLYIYFFIYLNSCILVLLFLLSTTIPFKRLGSVIFFSTFIWQIDQKWQLILLQSFERLWARVLLILVTLSVWMGGERKRIHPKKKKSVGLCGYVLDSALMCTCLSVKYFSQHVGH